MNPFPNLLEAMSYIWPNAIITAVVFIALLFRPERIVKHNFFKVGCVFFVLSLLTPSLVSLSPTFSVQNIPAQRANSGSMLLEILGLIQPLTFFYRLPLPCMVTAQ